jgi:hypothetical protein
MLHLCLLVSATFTTPVSPQTSEGIRLISFEELAGFANTLIPKNKLATFHLAWEVKDEVEIGRELYFESAAIGSKRKPVLYKWNALGKVWTQENEWDMGIIDLGDREYYKFTVKGHGVFALMDVVRSSGKTEFAMAHGFKLMEYRLVQPSAGIVLEGRFKAGMQKGAIAYGNISPLANLTLKILTPKGEVQISTIAGKWMRVPFYYPNKYGLYFGASKLKKEIIANSETILKTHN